MALITKEINLNVRQPNNYQLVNAMQGTSDNQVRISANIYDGEVLFTGLTNFEKCILYGHTVNGCLIEKEATISSSSSVYFDLDENLLAMDGELSFNLSFENYTYDEDDNIISTTRFPTYPFSIFVTNSPANELSERETVYITELVDELRESVSMANANALLSKSYAVGGTGVRENENVDNAKYYYELIQPYIADLMIIVSDTEPLNQGVNQYWDKLTTLE